jgi:hypothetical protein
VTLSSDSRKSSLPEESFVSALAWWLIPLAATVLAVLFVTLRSRPAKPTTAEDSMERLRRMQQAMERPMPQGPRPDETPRDGE